MAFLGRLLTKDSLRALNEVTTNLEFLVDAVTQISEFYRLCAGAMPKEEALWNSLAEAEVRHADTVKRMIEMISREPKLYKPGILFSTVIVRMFALEMKRLVEQMIEGRISPEDLFAKALQIEESAVEVSYGKIVKTNDSVFNLLAHRIDSESAEHRSLISAKMIPKE